MPMPAKGARLAQRKRKGREPVWVIKDTGGVEISTSTSNRNAAETALAEYIASKARAGGPVAADEMTVAEVLDIYGREHAPTVAAPERLGYAMAALLPFWGSLPVSAIKGATCRLYATKRGRSAGTIRRELNTLSAALNHCAREGYLLTAPPVTMPPSPETNQRALTRDEAAKLIRSARRRGAKHVAQFIIVSLYTGTRKDAALRLRLEGPCTTGGWFDLDARLLYRRGEGERVTNKRRTPARIPRQLAAHARRWKANGQIYAIEYQGSRIADLKTAFAKAAKDAGLGWVPTPHTLKHTAITWAIQGGASITDAAGFFATSIETIERTYWHLSPDFQAGAVEAMERKRFTPQTRAKQGPTKPG